jgi:N-acetylglucosaminyldiphosphoundecaprenol N-acetyl-beta-D-mannosaminyltransferase
MLVRNRIDIMGVPIDNVSLVDALNKVIEFMEKKCCSLVITPNTEIVMNAQKDPELLEVIQAADLVVPDGIGLLYASKILRQELQERVTGVDLMREVLEYCNQNKKSIYIFGGKPGVAEKAKENILAVFSDIQILGTTHGYFDVSEEEAILNRINESKPHVLFVALGAPKQEKWMYRYQERLKAKVAMGVGGSVDIWAGTAKRAPKIYQKLGLEWFYRLLKEPWRYKRMMSLPKFMIKVIWNRK